MSLLNDMLRDLSQHKPVVDGAEGYDESLLQSSSITRRQEQSWKQLALLFVAIFVIVLSANYVIRKISGSGAAQTSANVIEQKQTRENSSVPFSVEPSASKMAATSVKVVDTPVVAEKIASGSSASVELQNHIADLLQQAERSIGMDRLTSPVEDNAYTYYQKILGMAPDNNEAKEGLDRIASRYLVKAEEQMQLGNAAQAETLIQRARFVSERYVQAHEISLDGTAQSIVDTAAQTTEIQASSAQQDLGQKQIVTTADSIKPFPVAEAPMVSVAPNAAWKDEQLAHHAQELISQGKQTDAIALLKAFIATEQKPVLSALALADIYVQQGNTDAAEIILTKTDYLPVEAKAKIQAQILSAKGDDAKAINLLEQNLRLADGNESYRALLASLYHKTAMYSQSIISYQRLMNNFGEKPAYWLGLALAYDGLAQHKSALQAYQRLREYPQLQEQVKKYTDQRIAALRSE